MVLLRPTACAAKLMADNETAADEDKVIASATVVADNQESTDALISGNADIAAIATNVAATLSAKTDGAIQVLAVNTLGVLYILEKGDSVNSMLIWRARPSTPPARAPTPSTCSTTCSPRTAWTPPTWTSSG